MRILLAPGAAAGGGGTQVVEDVDAGLAVLALRGQLDPEMLKVAADPAEAKKKDEEAAAAAAKVEADKVEAEAVAARADEAGRTVEEQQAWEASDEGQTELAAQALAERATEAGRTVEEQQAFEEEEIKKAGEKQPEFTDEQKEWLTQQGLLDAEGKVVKTEADVEALTKRAEEAEAKAKDFETKLSENGGVRVTVAPLHRFFTIGSPADLEKEEQGLADFEKWCIKNWDGVKATEASDDGKVKAHPGYTAEQVRDAYQTNKELREKKLPLARERLAQFQQESAEAKKVYPELFDSKRPESKVAQAFLKQVPGFRALFPNAMTMIGDMMRGERAREAADKAKKALLAKGGKGGAATKKAPTLPIGTKPAPAASGKGAAKGIISLARVEELGGGRDALVRTVQEAMGS